MTEPIFKKVLLRDKSTMEMVQSAYLCNFGTNFWYTTSEVKCFFCHRTRSYPLALNFEESLDGDVICYCYSDACLASASVWRKDRKSHKYPVKVILDV